MAFDDFWLALRRGRTTRERPSGVVVLRRTMSSHDLARRLVAEYTAESSDPPPLDIHAWEQTAGRGRRDRVWVSPPGGGVYCSLIRSVTSFPTARLPVAVPVAIAETLRRRAATIQLKWPNDLVAGGRKLGGILLDVVSQPNGSTSAIVSFGINVDSAAMERVPDATSLMDLAPETGDSSHLSAEVTEDIIRSIDQALALADEDWVERYRMVSAHRPGDALTASVDGEVVEGTFDGFDEHGFLRLRTAQGERRLVAGELHAGAPADG